MSKSLPARALGASVFTVVLALVAALLSPVAASAAVPGSVAGVVTLSTGAVGKGVSVQLVALASDGSALSRNAAFRKVTGASGAFSIPGVASGRYTLEFGAVAGHGLQFLGGATTVAAADTFTVSENRSSYLRAGLVGAGTLSVSVKSAAGKAVAGAVVTAFARNDHDEWTARGSAATGKTGLAGLALTPGTYRLSARGTAFPLLFSGGQLHVGEALEVQVSRGVTTTYAFVPETTGGVSGTVAGFHDGVTVPKLAGVTVTALRLNGTPGNYFYGVPITSTVTSATGAFTLAGLLPGVDYTLRFDTPQKNAQGVALDPRYGSTLLGGTNTMNAAEYFSVTAGTITPLGTRTLTEDGKVTGIVREYPGWAPAANVPIFARRAFDFNAAQLPGEAVARTAADGSFVISGLGAGTWAIQAGSGSEETRVSATLNGNRYPYTVTAEVVAGGSTSVGNSMTVTAVNPGDEATLFTPTTISGTPQVGQTLTASDPVYHYGATSDTFFSGAALTVWLRNGRAIPGVLGGSYTLTGADAGAQISARVHSTFTTRPWQSSDSAAVTVTPGVAPTPLTPPTFSPTRKVGEPIVAHPGTYSLPGTTPGFEWCADTNDNGECDGPVLGTGASFTPSPAQLGAELLVKISAFRLGYATVSSTHYVGVVGQGTLSPVKAPVVTKKGTILTVTPGTWSALGSTYAYAWIIFDPATQSWVGMNVGTPSVNVASFAGRAIRVQVAAMQAGFTSGVTTVTGQVGTQGPPSAPTTLPATVSPSTLDAPVPTWAADPGGGDTVVTWQWQYLKAKKWLPLAGKTASSIVIPDAWIGRSLRVVLTARTVGYAPRVLVTNATVVALHPAPAGSISVTNGGSPAIGTALTAVPGAWAVPGVAVTYAWQSRAAGATTFTAIAKATKASYTPTEADFGRELRVVMTGTKASYRPATIAALVGTVAAGTLHEKVPGEVSVDGDVHRLQPPTFVEGTVTVAAVQWFAATPGSNTSTMIGTGPTVPVAGTEGKQVRASVTLSRAKYSTVVVSVFGTSPASLAMTSPGTISIPGGVARVGQEMTVTGTTFSGVQPAFLTYQWVVANLATSSFDEIPGATGASYTPARAYVGKALAVYVYGNREGYNRSGSYLESAILAPGFGLTPGVAPLFTAAPTVGVPLTGTSGGAWSEPATFVYEWKRQASGVVVSTKASYTPVPADLGQSLVFTVLGKVPGLASAFRAETVVVQPGTLTVTKNPVVTKKGTTLSVSAATWSKKPSSVVVSWNIYDRATGTSTVVTAPKLNAASHAGKRITVSLTAQLVGYSTATKTLTAQNGRGAAFVPGPGGTMIADAALASASNLGNQAFWDLPGATTTYQWKRNGAVIPGATAFSYSYTPADTGAQLTVVIGKASPGYATTATTFAVPFRIASISPLVSTATPAVTGTATVAGTLTTTAGSWNTPGLSYAYQWYTADGTALSIPGATTATLSPGPELAGASVFVRVTASKPYFAPVYSESNRVAIGFGMPPAAATPAKITRSGDTFTASLGALPAGLTVGVQWFTVSGGVATPITGATGITLATTLADVGTTYRAVFTATRLGFRTATFASGDLTKS